jgi:AcrR family transcriptional regulator
MRLDREKILDSCLEMFGKYGFQKASLADIVKPLRVTKAAIYNHFPGGKEEMLLAVIEREERRILEKMRAAVKGDDPPRLQLRALLMAKLNHFQMLRRLFGVRRETVEEMAKAYASRQTSFHEAERNLIAEIIRNGQKRGLLKKRDPDRLAYLLQWIQKHLELPFVLDHDEKGMEAFVDEVWEILLRGISKPIKLNRE